MLFNSWKFLVFFPLITALYFALPHRWRWYWLLLASSVFYMAFVPAYILILAFTIIVDYFAGLLIARAEGKRRLALLWVSILSNLGILGFFKYFNFVNDNLHGLATLLHWNYPVSALAILLPIGLSFHIFQSLSYTIEVYRGHQAPERHFGTYALYVMFYPQLVAGPIERPQNLLHQLHAEHAFDARRVANGLKLMLGGFFMKLMIADRLALVVDPVFDHPTGFTGVTLMAASAAFSFQIFCDFAGYSAIAIGAAQVMGISLMTNFRRPYHARSIAEFWTRWHISLSTWFKDYLYIPLGGNRVAFGRWCLNTVIVFMVSGLWHGASWTFVVWGALHAVYMVVGRLTRPIRDRAGTWLSLGAVPTLCAAAEILGTFSLVTFAWIFFRAASLQDAWYVVTHLFQGLGPQLAGPRAFLAALYAPDVAPYHGPIALGAIVAMEAAHLVQSRVGGLRAFLALQPTWVRWATYQAVIVSILVLGIYESRAFIYFQF